MYKTKKKFFLIDLYFLYDVFADKVINTLFNLQLTLLRLNESSSFSLKFETLYIMKKSKKKIF